MALHSWSALTTANGVLDMGPEGGHDGRSCTVGNRFHDAEPGPSTADVPFSWNGYRT